MIKTSRPSQRVVCGRARARDGRSATVAPKKVLTKKSEPGHGLANNLGGALDQRNSSLVFPALLIILFSVPGGMSSAPWKGTITGPLSCRSYFLCDPLPPVCSKPLCNKTLSTFRAFTMGRGPFGILRCSRRSWNSCICYSFSQNIFQMLLANSS